jgi:RNA polymerase sigma-70 factor (ECF subfamily)
MDKRSNQQIADDQPEAAWIRAFLANDRSAFDKLVVRHQDRVFNLCYRLLGDREEASDCAQEVFVKVYRSLKGFRGAASFSTWLGAIAVNTCKNRLKSKEHRFWRKVVRIDPPPKNDERTATLQLADPAPSPLAQLTQKEQDRLLQEAINGLPPEARAVIVLRDVEGLSYEEITQITGYNPGTVKSKLARARRQLRECVEHG